MHRAGSMSLGCHCKCGALLHVTFFGKAFGLTTLCPLDLVFFSSEDCECHTASIYMSLQGWQADVLRQAFGFSSARCASSAAVNVTRPASIYVDRIR